MRAAAVSLGLILVAPGASRGEAPQGVVVEAVGDHGAAAQAGLKPGDVVLGWRRAASPPANPVPAQGTLASPFDLRLVEVEHAPRGPVTFSVQRGGEQLALAVASTRWYLEVRPNLGEAELAEYLEVRRLAEEGETEAAAGQCRKLALTVLANAGPTTAAWLLARGGELVAGRRAWDLVHRLYAEALETVGAEGALTGERAWLYEAWGVAYRGQRQYRAAESRHLEALRLQLNVAPGSLAVADCYNDLGIAASRANDLDRAESYYRKALTIRERQAPGSFGLAATVNNLGSAAFGRGDLDQAEELFRRALAIRSAVVPGSLDEAASLNNVGMVAWQRGDLGAAQSLVARALGVRQAYAPDSLDVARNLDNLGILAVQRGDLATAEQMYRQALALKKKLAPDSLEQAATHTNLGGVALRRGDLAGARESYRRALELTEQHAPKSLRLAHAFGNLAIVAQRSGDLAEAERLLRLSVPVVESLAPESPALAEVLHELAFISAKRGESDRAEQLFRRVLRIKTETAPGSLAVATTVRELGVLAAERGAFGPAEELLRQALTIRQALARGSQAEAESLHDLGSVCRATGRGDEAVRYFEEAVSALELQQGRLGGSQRVRTEFRAAHQRFFHDLMVEMLRSGRPEEAFAVLERSRAYGLLAMLAERELVFSADLPAELERERRVNAVAYDHLKEELGKLSPGADAARVELSLQLARLRRQREELAEEVRREAPGLAALQYPSPLGVKEVLEILDPGTVLLAYAVAPADARLFVVSRAEGNGPSFAAIELEVDGPRLETEVQAMRDFLRAGRRPGASDLAVRRCGRRLYDWLLRPAEAWTSAAERIVICPDGVLHTLPFAATVRSDGNSQHEHYLLEWRPVHTAVSATVYAELKKARPPRRRPAAEIQVVAVGDPVYAQVAESGTPKSAGPPPALRPLPASRREVEGVIAIWQDQARAYLGAEATEERVKNLGPGTDILHLACHGILDHHVPLDSALALSSAPHDPATISDNGLLQAWEILEQVRLDADLVILSACDTGLGEHLQGEGLIGLTRAFHHAGARSIVASLWEVSDQSTAVLMRQFHSGLHAGSSKDEALRQAQLALLAGGAVDQDDEGQLPRQASHPYSWAGFQLIGDWQ